jgi:hypothetical protein
MYYQVFYSKNNEEFNSEFGVMLFDKSKTPFLFMELYYENGDITTEHGFTLADFIEHFRSYEFEEYYSKKNLTKLLQEIRADLYYINEYIGGWQQTEYGKKKDDLNAYRLKLIDSMTKDVVIELEYYFVNSIMKTIANGIIENIIPYEETEEYKEKARLEQEELERQRLIKDKENREKEEAIAKANEENRLKEYYENLLMEQEKRHKAELIALKEKELEELRNS